MPDRVASFFTAEPMRVTAFLRLPLIALVAVLVWIWEVDHWLPGVDVLVVVVLCLVSGGATAALLPVFFLLPTAVAFQDRPTLIALLGIGTALGYPAVWIVYSRRDDSVGLPDVVYTKFGFLLWSAVATTVTELHPQVLAQLGLIPAIRELLQQSESRGDYVIDADLDDVGKPESQQLLYRAARELLANIHKHAGATVVRVGLLRRGDRIVLTVADDGRGFDPATVEQYVADGHIGPGSLLARFDAMGGSMHIDSVPGRGTQVTVTSPPEPAGYALKW